MVPIYKIVYPIINYNYKDDLIPWDKREGNQLTCLERQEGLDPELKG